VPTADKAEILKTETLKRHPPRRRFRDAAQNFQQRAFASTVPADNAHYFAPLDLEGNVLERPEIFHRFPISDFRFWNKPLTLLAMTSRKAV
jgi:hypothetical protein